MTTFKHALKTLVLDSEARVREARTRVTEPIDLDSPALLVMTDLRHVRVVTIGPEIPLPTALTVMKHANVRLLAVIDEQRVITGLVSANDLMGEKPLRIANSERIRHEEVQVADIMSSTRDIQPLDFAAVEHASVRDVVAHLVETSRQHALVIEAGNTANDYVARGIFSATQIGRQLGQDIPTDSGRADSFADLEKRIA